MFEKIKEIIIDQLSLDPSTSIEMDTDLRDDLNADSLDAVEIIMTIEEDFDIKVQDEDIEDIRTIGDIISYIENNEE